MKELSHEERIYEDACRFLSVLKRNTYTTIRIQSIEEECISSEVNGNIHRTYLSVKVKDENPNNPNYASLQFSISRQGQIVVGIWLYDYDEDNMVSFTDFSGDTYTLSDAYKCKSAHFWYEEALENHMLAIRNIYYKISQQLLEILTKWEDQFGITIINRIKE